MEQRDNIILELNQVSAGYNGAMTIYSIDLKVAKGEIVLLVGANGAGKSTLLRTIFGFIKPTSGKIYLKSELLNDLPPHIRAKKGISYMFQDRRIFHSLTVEENILVAHMNNPYKTKVSIDTIYQRYPLLALKRNSMAGLLSGGEQQLLAIARALMQTPSILLLDEPSAGLSPKIANQIFSNVRELANEGIACLMVEHRIKEAVSISNRVIGLKSGEIQFTKNSSAIDSESELVHSLFFMY